MRAVAVIVGLFVVIVPLVSVFLLEVVPGIDPPVRDKENVARTLANNAPYFAQNLPLFLYATTDIPFDLTIKVADANDDTVNVTWEWGDGTPNALNTTPPASAAVWVNQTHTWTVQREPGVGDFYAGPFLVNITLDDGMGGVSRTQRNAYVYVPPNGIPDMSMSAPSKVDPADSILIVANATDPEGDPLTWTFVFNNSVTDFYTEVHETPATAPNETVWVNMSYVFGVVGNYTVKLNVTDALVPNQVWPHNVSFSVSIEVAFNQAPQMEGAMDTDPESLIMNASMGYLVVNYSVEAFDPDGDILYVIWDMGDGTSPMTNVSAGGKQKFEFVQQRNYTDTGVFNISVVIGDGRPGHNVSLYQIVEIESTNLPPSVMSLEFIYSSGRGHALPNETIFFALVMGDAELNSIEVIVNFGDNSSEERYVLSQFDDGNVSLTLNHSYASPGEYLITIWYSDNKSGLFEHSKYYNLTVVVKELPPVMHKYWDWWDYTSLALLICALVVPTVWLIRDVMRKED